MIKHELRCVLDGRTIHQDDDGHQTREESGHTGVGVRSGSGGWSHASIGWQKRSGETTKM